MTRYPQAHKAQTHAQVVATASAAFRAQGVTAVSIPALMNQLGLTHGGFYAHFPSKDALAAEACARPLLRRSEELAQLPPGAEALRQVIAAYISPQQRDHPGESCPLPSLAGELARATPEVRHAFTEALQRYLDRLAALLSSEGAERERDQAFALAAEMVGAVLLARVVDDSALSDRILTACRTFALAAFAGAEATAGASP
ncbi:MAG: TetR/AcrR family transcriptional regulator [Thermomicrobiales bacterium]